MTWLTEDAAAGGKKICGQEDSCEQILHHVIRG
jgi:hypothetical protein